MVDDGSNPGGRRASSTQNPPPLELMNVISPALQFGGLTGASGLIFGAVGGVLKSTTPTLFALASGLQWFTLGSTYWATRTIVLNEWQAESIESSQRVAASAIAGGVSGGIGGLLRSKRNIIPGTIVFALLGGLGQVAYNFADSRERKATSDQGSWLNSRWSPVKALSDDEYGKILQERLLRLNAEIALLDENIDAVKRTAPGTTAPKDGT